jgi:hypothetical protein
MKKKNYKPVLARFKKEIKDTSNHVFHDVDDWTMADDLLNGVLIGYRINQRSERDASPNRVKVWPDPFMSRRGC